MSEQLYFIAIVPDNPVQMELMEFKNISKEKFNTRKSLNSPAHITIVPPFKYNPVNENLLKKSLQSSLTKTRPFYININGFNKFGTKVIFVDVEDNENLKRLKEQVTFGLVNDLKLNISLPNNFHPHITVAFRDLSPQMFPMAWSYFSNIEYQRICKVNSICLLKHNGRNWDITKNIGF